MRGSQAYLGRGKASLLQFAGLIAASTKVGSIEARRFQLVDVHVEHAKLERRKPAILQLRLCEACGLELG